MIYVILDNGHGVNTPGKCSPDKRLYEWSWNRDIVRRISARLNEINIPNEILVTEDFDVPLNERVKRANKMSLMAKKQGLEPILISIHINASGNGGWKSANGWSVWVSNNASMKSREFAQILYAEAEKLGLKGNRSTPNERYWTSNFYILKNTNCPAVLTENMFQDNKDDVEFLLSEEGKNKITELHIEAIKKSM